MDDEFIDDPLLLLDEDEALTLAQLVTRGYDFFWNQCQLSIDLEGKPYRTDVPRERPRTWFCYMDEDLRDRITH
jgi:hypothetical protein